MKEIKESRQTSQGINIGNSGNQGGACLKVKEYIINEIQKMIGILPTKDLPQGTGARMRKNNFPCG